MNIVFLASGGGGNLRFVEMAIRKGWLPDARIAAVIADRECPSIDFARALKIDAKVTDFSRERQVDVIREIENYTPDAIVTNVHKILTNEFVVGFRGRLLNLHYSLLPAFPGTIGIRSVQQAIAYGAKFVGVTAHYVDEGVDTGRPISQAAIPLTAGDHEIDLMDVVFRTGCLSLLTALRELLRTRPDLHACMVIPIKGREVIFNPAYDVGPDFLSENFWDGLRA